MRIAVYSGSFDPLHIGHLAILRTLCSCGGYDRVLLVISPQNPFKDSEKAKSGRARYEAALEAVARHSELDKLTVSDVELGMEPPHYTIRTLDFLRSQHPKDRFTLIIGADNLASMRRWREYRRLLTEYGVSVFPRKGYDIDRLRSELIAEDGAYIIGNVDAPLVDVSSTQIREGISHGSDISGLLM